MPGDVGPHLGEGSGTIDGPVFSHVGSGVGYVVVVVTFDLSEALRF
jgi:hypothetical protein